MSTDLVRVGLPIAARRAAVNMQGVTGYGLVIGGAAYGQHNSTNPWAIGADTELDVCRFEVRSGDTWAPGGSTSERSELFGQRNFDFDRDVWISTRIMVEPGPANTGAWLVLLQVHRSPDPGDATASPPFALELNTSGTPIITTRGTSSATNTGNPAPTVRWQHPNFRRGVWDHYVIRSKFSFDGSGELQMWRNGSQEINVSGILNAYNDAAGPYPKFGLYRGPASETTVAWHAGFRAGHESLAHLIDSPPYVPGA